MESATAARRDRGCPVPEDSPGLSPQYSCPGTLEGTRHCHPKVTYNENPEVMQHFLPSRSSRQ